MSNGTSKNFYRFMVAIPFAALAACGGQDETSFIPDINQPPVVVLDGPEDAKPGDVVVLDGSASHDPDGDELAFDWSSSGSQQVELDVGETGDVTTFVVPEVEGDADFGVTLTVSDGIAEESASWSVTVAVINHPPKAVMNGPEQVVAHSEVVLDASMSHDLDDDVLALEWSQPQGQSIELQISESGETATFTAPEFLQDTDLQFAVEVDDGTASDSVIRHVRVKRVNHPPVVVMNAPESSDAFETVVLDASASSDPNDDLLTYEWSQSEGQDIRLYVSDTGETASFTAPVFEAESALQFTVSVSDGEWQRRTTREIIVVPTDYQQQVSLDVDLMRMSAANDGEFVEEVGGKLLVETIDANGVIVDEQQGSIDPGLPAVFGIPTEGERFRYRVMIWPADAYAYLEGFTGYVFGRIYSLNELLVAQSEPVTLEVQEHEATAYMRTVHVVTENDPDHPDLEPGTRITESKIHIAGRNEDMSLASCVYSWSDYGFQDTTGYPFSDLSVIETLGSCPKDVDSHVYGIELSPEAWQAIRNDDSGHDGVMAEWTSFYIVSGDDDEFRGGFANRSLGARLFIDGERIY